MLIFKTVSWKNFLSTGNSANEVKLNANSSTLIVGKNGEGKSTMLDALTFVLFGKPFRDINKNQLVNSINKKNCEVTVEFELNGREYKVIRGIKPNIFEIHCDGELLNKDAALKDYQKVLEQQILRLNYKTFTQVVILGSSSFVPFMQLPTGQRREVIEDILDIRIFSIMNQLLKEKVSKTKEQLNAVETEMRILTEQAKSQQALLRALESNQQQNKQSIEIKLEENRTQIELHRVKIQVLTEKFTKLHESLPDELKLRLDMENAVKSIAKYDSKVSHVNSHIEFFTENSTCPSCEQGIEHDHAQNIITKLQNERKEYSDNMKIIKEAQEKLASQMETMNEILGKIKDVNINISTENSSISILQANNAKLTEELKQVSNDTNIEPEKEKLKAIAEKALTTNIHKVELHRMQKTEEVASTLLKDTGIKTAIIREYLPVMNKLINKYLTAMDFFVHFELDENFNEVIKSRHRDEFTYASFSEGEKMRLDLAILFTWRQIAKMKNSVNTNLLILDEVFDSSLDTAGTDYFLNIMNSFGENSNIFVISHKGDQLLDKFENTIKFEKKNDFSVVNSVQ